MGKYLTEVERYKIETMLKDGLTPCQVAERLGKHFTTIYKEIKKGTVTLRNSDWTERKEYCADVAQRITNKNQTNKGRDLKIGHDFELVHHIEYLIKEMHYSPYAVICDIRKSKKFETDICKTTLYNYIDKGLFLGISNKDLYSKKNKKKDYEKVNRPSYKNKRGKSIEERPKAIDKREEYGHWEMDTVYSGKNTSKACLLVLTERMTREEYIMKLVDRTFNSTLKALDTLERILGHEAFKERFKTITVDNGNEFSDSDSMERSCFFPDKKRTDVYFVRRHIVGGANRILISVLLPPRLCSTGTCLRLSAE